MTRLVGKLLPAWKTGRPLSARYCTPTSPITQSKPEMSLQNRREFLTSATGAVAALIPGWGNAMIRPPQYDLLIRGGKVIDPSQQLHALRDVAISRGRIARIAERIDPSEAVQVVDATGKIVTPGLIDSHVHVYDGVSVYAIAPDVVGVARGVTTLIDSGSAGANTFNGFRRYVVQPSRTRIFCILNISSVGLAIRNELHDLSLINNDSTVRVVEANRDVIVGIKVRLTQDIPEGQDLEVMRLGREAGDRAGVPLMVHIGGQRSALPEILKYLRPGDVITHVFASRGGLLDDQGRVFPEVFEAVRNGIRLDVGHGSGHFNFAVAERLMGEGLLPTSISSDVHRRTSLGPVFDLPHILSKLIATGMTLEQVIAAATAGPGLTYKFPEPLGTIREGAVADIATFEVAEGEYDFADNEDQHRLGRERLLPWVTLLGGIAYG